MPRTVSDVISQLPVLSHTGISELPAPAYHPPKDTRTTNSTVLGVASMADHMSNEGWQLVESLEYAGWSVRCGSRDNPLDCKDLLHNSYNPKCIVVQDKREWDRHANRLAHPHEFIHNVHLLADHEDVFKVTVLKDSHQRPPYHRYSAAEMGCHAWIVYYHPAIVKHLAPYVRPQHLVRTYHSIDSTRIPEPDPERQGCLLSGALSPQVYPLRYALAVTLSRYPRMEYLRHPGYHNRGTNTNQYLNTLNQFKVAICTSSIYGYSLRKLIESTACGCMVITDLPVDDPLPYIDDNLIRLQGTTIQEQCDEIAAILPTLYRTYDFDLQKRFSELAKSAYDYRVTGCALSRNLHTLMEQYNGCPSTC